MAAVKSSSSTGRAASPAVSSRQRPTSATPPRVPEDSRDNIAVRLRVWDHFCHGWCHGWRAPEIASDEGIPERTTRRWIASTRDEIYADLPELRATQFAAALDGLRTLLAESWDAYRAERDMDDVYNLPAYTDLHAGITSDLKAVREHPPLQRRSNAPRYLALALQTQREIVRLLGLHQGIPDALAPTPEMAATPISATSATPTTAATPSTSATSPADAALPPVSSLPPAQHPHPVAGADPTVGAHGRAPDGAPASPPPIPAAPAIVTTPPPKASMAPSPAGAGSPTSSQPGHSNAPQRGGNRGAKSAIPAKTATLAARHRSNKRGPILLPKRG